MRCDWLLPGGTRSPIRTDDFLILSYLAADFHFSGSLFLDCCAIPYRISAELYYHRSHGYAGFRPHDSCFYSATFISALVVLPLGFALASCPSPHFYLAAEIIRTALVLDFGLYGRIFIFVSYLLSPTFAEEWSFQPMLSQTYTHLCVIEDTYFATSLNFH